MNHPYLIPWMTLCTLTVQGQSWCVPSSAIPYATSMPGITRFQLNTIDRMSADLENYPGNSYVLTGLSTTLVKGQSYPVTIQFTVDQPICPDMNLRVWIDLNHDGQLDDPGETLLSIDHVLPTIYTGSITIPASAMIGNTRLRVTAKMSNLGGHILPTPCDIPADPLGYHGEIEDYTVNIVAATGVGDLQAGVTELGLTYDALGQVAVNIAMAHPATLRMDLFDVAGRAVGPQFVGQVMAGRTMIPVSHRVPGTYVLRLVVDDRQVRAIPLLIP